MHLWLTDILEDSEISKNHHSDVISFQWLDPDKRETTVNNNNKKA